MQFHLEEIDTLFETYKEDLFELKEPPNLVELTALASVLHSFYNGIEKIFLIIAKELDQLVPKDMNWHKQLLNQMSKKTDFRNEVISQKTKESLANYLAFRHFFRPAYSFYLEWDEMERLIVPMKSVWKLFKFEIKSILHNEENPENNFLVRDIDNERKRH